MTLTITYPKIPLRELLTQVSRPIRVVATDSYRSLGVKWYAKGLFIKDTVKGSEIKATRLFVVEEDDFIYNRLFAWKGSFAVAGAEHAGCVVSGEFPVFRINPDKISLMYLMAFFSSPWLWDLIAGKSSGTAEVSRLRLKEEAFLRLAIPLPPLKDQERVVCLLDEADQLRKLRAQADQRADTLIPALFHEMFGGSEIADRGWPIKRLGDLVLPVDQRDPRSSPSNKFSYVDIASVDNKLKVISESKEILGADAPSRARKVIRKGDVIVSTVRPNLNAVACIPEHLDNQICSTGFSVLRPSKEVITEYLFAFATSQSFISHLSAKTAGANYPAVNDGEVKDVPVPLPPIALQKEFSLRVSEIQELKKEQSPSREHLDDLFQSMLHRAFRGEL